MITAEIIVAANQCKLKAHSLLSGRKKGLIHEYVTILEERAKKNRAQYYNRTRKEVPKAVPYNLIRFRKGIPILLNANLRIGELEAHADAITRDGDESLNRKFLYHPTLVVGTHKISKEQKLQLAFIGYVLSKLQKGAPVSGTIVGNANSTHRIKLGPIYKDVQTVLKHLDKWIRNPKIERPSITLNKHCSYCCFQKDCKAQAVEKDDLSLLGGITPAVLKRYQKKGIFTIHQLSFLFRPRKQRKRKKKTQIPLRYLPELRALAIRTDKIYLQELPELPRNKTELFLDIEGIPDQDFYYLIGLLVSTGKGQHYYSFWADSKKDEHKVWKGFIEMACRYPDASIFHYGAYDSRAIRQLEKRHGEGTGTVERRLFNVNSLIYSKVYFPVRSNSLKELGKLLGATWTHPDASGLQSLVWRHRWDESQNFEHRQLLLKYNEEDCKALSLLVKKLSDIIETADSKWNIDFVDHPKRMTTDVGRQIHEELRQILQSAHADYNIKKINIRSRERNEVTEKRRPGAQKGRKTYRRITPSDTGTVIRVRARRGKCPARRRWCKWLRTSDSIAEKVIIDLHFTKMGCRKRILRYVGYKAYCTRCGSYFLPQRIVKLGKHIFSHSFMAWVVYQRVVLREPYKAIIQTLQDLFAERISQGTISSFIRYFAGTYLQSEEILINRILASPFVHVDDTPINIQGERGYVWVFTDGKHVVFRKTQTREASIVHEFISNYDGVMVSDFYPGFDSARCRQQKCWVHLIRDLNDDLWKEPFNEEFEQFVLGVKDLIMPLFNTIQQYGSKRRHLNKFRKSIDRFFINNIDSKTYMSEVSIKYQKRFKRYRNSLFTFLSEDNIPWNNNMAERAIRHLAIQRKISGTFFDSLISQYLLLLGITQSCRFQGKPPLAFFLSEERDIDSFKAPKPKRYTKRIKKKVVERP